MPEPLTQDGRQPAHPGSIAFLGDLPQCGEEGVATNQRLPQGACWCAVDYASPEVHVQWGVGRRMLGAGPWRIELAFSGMRISPPARWEEVCRESEDGVAYLELEGRAARGVRVTRHLLVARKDGFLLAADGIVLSRPAEIQYMGVWPLSRKVSCQPAAETREARLTHGRRQAWVLPLALPEWRDDPRRGELVPWESGLALRQWSKGRGMFAPLFIDLETKHKGKPLTWRALTVAENFRIQPPDMAVGYRVQIGSQQWLVYRSLGPKGNRSLLGHNLVSETLVARFVNGEVEPLLEIE